MATLLKFMKFREYLLEKGLINEMDILAGLPDKDR
jgi:hypothetical protein